MSKITPWKTPLLWFGIALALAGILAYFGPPEKALGSHVRVVYLHGALVWSALASFLAAGASGAAGLVFKRENFHRWSRALGRTGLIFWLIYLPLSMWAMQANWNGLFLEEPRWRLALIFAITGLLIQAGITLLGDPIWASAANILFLAALLFMLLRTPNVMHPASPIFSSGAWRIEAYFTALLAFVLLAAWQLACWLHARFEASFPEKGR